MGHDWGASLSTEDLITDDALAVVITAMGLWGSLINTPARLSRWGVAFCLVALILWLSTIVFRTGHLPAQEMDDAAEFLAVVGAILYGVDKAAGRIRHQKDD